ncbi:hypothetical protein QQS21_005558 [Conoideocrella luteorostrata]|uniref:Ubiquitin-like domain-containing protein n=1 Tax=Conoideocrella luteorostrata TaxID=1105319 RepID=A0AAJ0FTP9_9HYPO|nr:hypothetical protein QQS21_005558 [Conoideocrella luteorostrata]
MLRPAHLTSHRGGESSRSTSYHSEGGSSHHEAEFSAAEDDDDWQDIYDDEVEDEEDLHPFDSASASNDIPPSRQRPARAVRHHRVTRSPAQDYPSVPSRAPNPPPSVDPPEEYGPYGQGYAPHHAPRGGYYGRGQHPGFPQQQQQGHYMGGYPGGNQMVPYGYAPNNPFTPMSNTSSGASFFGGESRHMYDMMPYQQPGYFPGPQYSLPAHLQQFHLAAPPPPATEAPAQPPTPAAKEPPPDLEKIKIAAELAAFKAQEEKAKAAEEQREREAQIRKDAEEAFQRRMDDIKKAQEEAQKEIARARVEAERAARERIEAERKAEEERQKQHAEAMKRAEESARLKIEAEIKAAEVRRQKEEEDRKRAEEAAQRRVEAAIKAEAEAKAAAEKKVAEEAERLKLAQEDAKRKAEIETLKKVEEEKEAAKKAAEAAEAAKAEAEALKKRIQDETKASLEEAAKKNEKAPISFKDAVGRKFSFPFHLCSTWQGMEELIKQAFLQVDVLGPHVREGHYDLIGPNGEIILPTVWEKVVQPAWNITMTMWPVEKLPPLQPKIPGMPNIPGRPRHNMPFPPGMMPPGMQRPGTHVGGGAIPPPGWIPGRGVRPNPNLPPDIVNVDPGPRPTKSSKHKPKNVGMLGFLAGKPSKKK